MDADTIELGLAAHGVPLFAEAPPPDFRPPALPELMEGCLRSDRARYRGAVIALLLVAPEDAARDALARLAGSLEPEPRRWLRWYALAAEALTHALRTDMRIVLGRVPRVPADVFERGGLPAADLDLGDAALAALADEIAAAHGAHVSWKGSLMDPARGLLEELWVRRAHATPGYSRAS